MASKYDDLDASTELEQVLTADLRAALEGRGCEVVHNGMESGGRHAPGGKADIEVRDPADGRLLLVEVTRRGSSSADGEFIAVMDHLQKAIQAGGYSDYGVFYVSPATSARLSSNFRDLWNRRRERDGKKGRVVAVDFEAAQMLLDRLAAAPPDLYPASRLGDLLARWKEAEDDALARLLVQRTIFPEDLSLAAELETEVEELAANRERRLKKQLEHIEDGLRDRGVVGDDANRVLIYLTFLRLYEERQQRLKGQKSRFTAEGFEQWCEAQPASVRNKYKGRMVEALLHEVAEDEDLRAASLLRDAKGTPHALHDKVRDTFVVSKLLHGFDEYDFHAGQIDVLGPVFETLARRGEKDTRIGQFFTPQPVVDFCAGVVPLKPGDVVLDPAVGTARFLIRAMGIMLERIDSGPEPKVKAERAIRTERLLGTDIGEWVATIAKMNMYIHGGGKIDIRVANGLVLGDRGVFDKFPNGLSGKVDVVLTNPPLGETSHVVAGEDWVALAKGDEPSDSRILLDRLGVIPMRVLEELKLDAAERKLAEADTVIHALEGALPAAEAKRRLNTARRARDRWVDKVAALKAAIAAGTVERRAANESMKSGALFLGAIADYLKPIRDPDAPPEWRGGWAAVVVDEAILNTPDYGPTREFIRNHFYVKAVVSLGRSAFKYLAHTEAKTSVVFLVRKPEPGNVPVEPTFYAHAERVGYGKSGEWVGNDLPHVKLLFEATRAAMLKEYDGPVLDPAKTDAAIRAIPGFASAFYAMTDTGGATRMDFFNARYVQRCAELHEQFGNPPRLGDFLAPAPIEHPAPHRRGEYPFAEINRVTGTVRKKGIQAVGYPPQKLWLVCEDDLVVSGIDAVHGAVAVASADVEGLVMSAEMFAYRVKDPSVASAVYLQLVLRSQAARELLCGMTTGTSNRTRLENVEQLLELPIPPLPPIADQRTIAKTFLSSVRSRDNAMEMQQDAESAVEASWWPDGQPGSR